MKNTAKRSGIDLTNVYEKHFDISALKKNNPELFEQLKKHNFKNQIPEFVPIFLHIISLGISNFFYFGKKHSNLPKIVEDDFDGGKAIGYCFIPGYNLFYWCHKVLARLAHRLNFQHKLRDSPYRVSANFSLTTSIIGLIPYLNLITFFILGPILVIQLQTSINKLIEIDYPDKNSYSENEISYDDFDN